jgi:hypothetical protein
VAVLSAVVGCGALIPYWIAADRAGETSPGFTVLVELLGLAGVLVLLRVHRLEHWVDGHVKAGR